MSELCLLIDCVITKRLLTNHHKKGKIKKLAVVLPSLSLEPGKINYRMSLCLRFEGKIKTYSILGLQGCYAVSIGVTDVSKDCSHFIFRPKYSLDCLSQKRVTALRNDGNYLSIGRA